MGSHPFFWDFLRKLQEVDGLASVRYSAIQKHHVLHQPRKENREREKRLQAAIALFESSRKDKSSMSQFLRNVTTAKHSGTVSVVEEDTDSESE